MALISGEIPLSKTELHLNAKATKLCKRTELYMEHVSGGSWLTMCVCFVALLPFPRQQVQAVST